MRFLLFLPSCVLCFVLLYLPNSVNSETETGPLAPGTDLQEQVTVVTDAGLEPRTPSTSRGERVAFFVSNSRDSLMTPDVNFQSSTTSCASNNLAILDDGRAPSTKPVSPKDFATPSLHETGRYPFTVKGVASYPERLQETIFVN
jgi:hypothetical protein